MSDRQFFPLAALQHNLERLLAVRVIVAGLQLLALLYARYGLGLALDYLAIGLVLLVFVLISIALCLRLRQDWPVSEAEFLGHLLVDVAGLSLLLYLTGGASNPFVSYYLVPLTIAAAVLPWRHTWIVAALSLLCYTLLLFVYRPLPVLMPAGMQNSEVVNLHVVGMWFNFLVSAVLITWFVVKMAREIRLQERKLTRYREDNLRNEQILAVATQAAGTAHELGTPLSTAAVLLREMELEYPDDPRLQQDVALLRQQVAVCKDSLARLANQADIRRGTPAPMPLPDFIRRVLDQWQLLRPEVKLALELPGADQAPAVTADATLQQAIVNILDNAADASPQRIDAVLFWDALQWGLRIRDHGPGIRREIREQLGTARVSTKEDGLGVGMLLSQASINRLGGEVRQHPHRERGTITEIRLPLHQGEAPS